MTQTNSKVVHHCV